MNKTARQKFGEVIAFHFAKQHKSDREVSDRCGVPIKDVPRWRTGELVPDRAQWKRACQMVSRSLFGVSTLHNEALREQEEEREATMRQLRANNGHRMTSNGVAVTNFGDKLVAAAIESVPQLVEPDDPQSDVAAMVEAGAKRPYAQLPPGSRMPDAIAERREFARSVLMQRPAITARGPDGLIELVRKRFGVGMSEIELKRIRDELERETLEREVRAKISQEQRVASPTHATPPASPTQVVATSAVNDAEVSAGVELIIGAIPGLQEMTIKIDDAGVASVNYSVRKVQVTTVSSQLTVRR